MADINDIRAAVNRVSPMSKDAANAMLNTARATMNTAIRFADLSDLPGQNTRAHELAAIDTVSQTVADSTLDPLSAQLAETVRSTTVNSFVELNAVSEGIDATEANSAMDAAVDSFNHLGETLGNAAAAVVGGVGGQVGNFAGSLLDSMFTNHPFVLLALGAVIYYAVKR